MYNFFFLFIVNYVKLIGNRRSIFIVLHVTQVMALDSLSTICEIVILRSVWYLRKIYEEFEDRFHSRTFWICPPYLHLFLTSLFPFSLYIISLVFLLSVSGYLFYFDLNLIARKIFEDNLRN